MVLILALGIGANAIFSLVCGVLLRPLVNRGEDRLIYESAPVGWIGLRRKLGVFLKVHEVTVAKED